MEWHCTPNCIHWRKDDLMVLVSSVLQALEKLWPCSNRPKMSFLLFKDCFGLRLQHKSSVSLYILHWVLTILSFVACLQKPNRKLEISIRVVMNGMRLTVSPDMYIQNIERDLKSQMSFQLSMGSVKGTGDYICKTS